MSLHVFQITVDIDDEMLAEWIGDDSEKYGGPYTKDMHEWIASDLTNAMDQEIIVRDDSRLDYMGEGKS